MNTLPELYPEKSLTGTIIKMNIYFKQKLIFILLVILK